MTGKREVFRSTVFPRDDNECLVPFCTRDAADAHHIIERELWQDGGYISNNGASVCSTHHRLAENHPADQRWDAPIPPQAFWRWAEITSPPTPTQLSENITKWGERLARPPETQYKRDNIKYPPTPHLPFSHSRDNHDDDIVSTKPLTEIPLVVTVKMDGGNAMLVRDTDEPVRARNGKYADHDSFSMLKQQYSRKNLYTKIPDHIQIFGEWIYARHSIHYGCDCTEPCEDIGPALRDYFQVFGIFDKRFNLWLSWDAVESWADRLGYPTVPVIPPERWTPSHRNAPSFGNPTELYDSLVDLARAVVEKGHEGIVVRSRLPFHYSQTSRRVAKYVRKNHVKKGATHWSKRPSVPNCLKD
jgi:hypothetical protein